MLTVEKLLLRFQAAKFGNHCFKCYSIKYVQNEIYTVLLDFSLASYPIQSNFCIFLLLSGLTATTLVPGIWTSLTWTIAKLPNLSPCFHFCPVLQTILQNHAGYFLKITQMISLPCLKHSEGRYLMTLQIKSTSCPIL